MPTGIKMTKKNRLAVLKEARRILSNPKNWTQGRLRRRKKTADDGYGYCLLGACEKAAYELGLTEPSKNAFRDSGIDSSMGLGYELGHDLSLYSYSTETRQMDPDSVNDQYGYESTLALLDDYIAEVKAGRPRKENNDG